ncbi:uncharacterized protein LOC131664531 [Phymastichus coffea]|uniref:uncharacterized protein LOC131664531 n=1 Tax=Phymastichus coffea TaxID=108790 RepID=UPI00273ABE53|nr:uncharacterized protein LOC131664531 [Phymastichus coffea]
MTDKEENKSDNFLSAKQLLEVRGVGRVAWDDWEQSETALPTIGEKHFEPTHSWLENMQIENGLKNRKKLLKLERVTRNSKLAVAEWLPGIQKAKVIKKSGQKWDNFGTYERSNFYLLPEEALMLLEMNNLEVLWNGMPLSIQQAYEVMINAENSKCTLDEYRVYSQLVKWGYKLQRFQDKSTMDNKFSNVPKRIIMNPEGLWTLNTSPTIEKRTTDNSSTTSKTDNGENDVMPISSTDQSENDKSPKKLGIVSEETVLGSIKIIKNTSPTATKSSSNGSASGKWSGSRIQRNVKLMPKRTEKAKNATDIVSEVIESPSFSPQKRQSDMTLSPTAKKIKPEVIELSDDEIEEIPRQMTRTEILNTFPNLAPSVSEVIVEVPRRYLPPGVKPSREVYYFNRNALMNLTQTDNMLRANIEVSQINNVSNGHFYSQGSSSQCQAITTYNSNNGYLYRGMRCQRDGNSYIQQNVSHNTIHNPLSGTVLQSNYFNLVLEVMGSMVRSFRQQQYQQTTFCHQNVQMFSPRFPQPHASQRMQPYSMHYDALPNRDLYYRRGGGGGALPSTSYQRGRGYAHTTSYNFQRPLQEDIVFQPAFTKRPGVDSWTDLKKKWREETTITIEDEEPMQVNESEDNSEIQVVETISPLISSKNGISSMAEVYERLRIIKSATDKTVRSRKVDYSLSYEVFSVKQQFKKSAPGEPMCRLYVINSKKEALLDASKIQRLQQESKDVPLVVAFVSQSCISYVQPGVVHLPYLS